jgi:hypothetical protein
MAWVGSPVWNEIKKSGSATITVSGSYRATIIQAVKKVKSHENVCRPLVKKPKYGPLRIEQQQISTHPERWRVTFTLSLDPDKL